MPVCRPGQRYGLDAVSSCVSYGSPSCVTHWRRGKLELRRFRRRRTRFELEIAVCLSGASLGVDSVRYAVGNERQHIESADWSSTNKPPLGTIARMSILPGGPIASRPLHFIWVLDTSGSMTGEKIGQLNFAIKEAIPAMQDTARENPNAQVLVRVVTFSDGARWHIGAPTPVADFKWSDITAGGVTDMGRALELVTEQLRVPPMADRALPPVLVLVSDGQPTDDFGSGLKALMSEPWGKKAVRISIAVGHDADLDVLTKFMGSAEMKPLEANNAQTLVGYIKWASTAVLKAASAPASRQAGDTTDNNVPLPSAPVASASDDDVW